MATPATAPLHVRGVLLPDDTERDIWLVDGRVTFNPVEGATTVADRGYVLPGLVDAHCHPGIAFGAKPVTTLAEARELAIVDRDAGVLAIRDAGSPIQYPDFDDDPELPRFARAGRHVAPVKRYLRDIGAEVGADEVAAEAARQAKAGNGWVKLVGDWIDRNVGDLAPSWEPAAMAAAIEAAHAAGARVTAHTFEEQAVAALVRAGVDAVDHGTGLNGEDIAEMAKRGTALIPTLLQIDTFDSIADRAEGKFPTYAAHMRSLKAGFPAVVASAYQAGVPIYVGTDAGGSIRHGLAAKEMILLHERVGMSRLDVLRAGSWGAREWLGFAGLVEGGLADLVVYDEDPRQDLRALLSPRRIVMRGQVVSGQVV